MKQAYELAEIEILSYCDEDVIRTSPMGNVGDYTGSDSGNETDFGGLPDIS